MTSPLDKCKRRKMQKEYHFLLKRVPSFLVSKTRDPDFHPQCHAIQPASKSVWTPFTLGYSKFCERTGTQKKPRLARNACVSHTMGRLCCLCNMKPPPLATINKQTTQTPSQSLDTERAQVLETVAMKVMGKVLTKAN